MGSWLSSDEQRMFENILAQPFRPVALGKGCGHKTTLDVDLSRRRRLCTTVHAFMTT